MVLRSGAGSSLTPLVIVNQVSKSLNLAGSPLVIRSRRNESLFGIPSLAMITPGRDLNGWPAKYLVTARRVALTKVRAFRFPRDLATRSTNARYWSNCATRAVPVQSGKNDPMAHKSRERCLCEMSGENPFLICILGWMGPRRDRAGREGDPTHAALKSERILVLSGSIPGSK